jgi:uncharacterized protein YfdQ (DUF2303 family)
MGDNTMIDGGAIREIAALAEAAGWGSSEVKHNGTSVPLLFRKGGDGIHIVGAKPFFDEWRTHPERRGGVAEVTTLPSFIDLTNRHKGPESAIFARVEQNSAAASMTAVIDYDSATSTPGNQSHRIAYKFPFSREWGVLAMRSGKAMTQTDFAEFIEDNIELIAIATDPEARFYETMFGSRFATPAEMLTLSRGMKISAEYEIADIRNLKSGEDEIRFKEVHKTATGEPLHVPGLIVFKPVVFDGEEVTRIVARLRYRRVESRIVWSFHLYRPEDVVREKIEEMAAAAREATKLPLYFGSPERR